MELFIKGPPHPAERGACDLNGATGRETERRPVAGVRARQGGLLVLVLFASVSLSCLLSFASKKAWPELREREREDEVPTVKEQALHAGGGVNHPLRCEVQADRQ